jgi:phospholipase D1/2
VKEELHSTSYKTLKIVGTNFTKRVNFSKTFQLSEKDFVKMVGTFNSLGSNISIFLIYRSIDSESIVGDHVYNVYSRIEHAYYESIKKAEKFIYIENQYFCGSGFIWISDPNKAIKNRIPLAILEKIIEKIQKSEDFVCMIVIPMYPAGSNPEGSVTQEQLYWQYKTMEMLYKRIGDELAKSKSNNVPSDYLRFYCLGNREDFKDENSEKMKSLNSQSTQFQMLKTKRCMVYVHSKLIIIDDEYMIIGSANLNERSLSGNGDTEICIGASEVETKKIKKFRKSLFEEHIGNQSDWEDISLDFKKINQISDENWEIFSGEEFKEMKSHLMSYPIFMEKDGNIDQKVEFFPDTKASIKGKESLFTPDILTI